MLQVTCKQCSATAYVDCTCEIIAPGTKPPDGHLALCPLTDLGSNVLCDPESGCCQESHSHDAAANACPGIVAGGHPGAPCPDEGKRCLVYSGGHSAARDLDPEVRVRRAGKCPGGHCGPGVEGCTICRPVTITLLPGSVNLTPAPGA